MDEEVQLSPEEVAASLQLELKVQKVTGFKPMKIDCRENKITREAADEAGRVIRRVVQELPDTYIIYILGHADKQGRHLKYKGEPLNDYLARERARSVANYLIEKYKIPARRLAIVVKGDAENEKKVTFVIQKKP